MSYSEREDLNFDEQRLVELTDSRETQGVVNEALVQKALDDADDFIDGHLEKRYVLPLDPVPGLIRIWAASVSRYYLYRRRDTMEIPPLILRDYQAAETGLAKVMENKIDLPCASIQAATAPGPTGGGLEDVPRRFGRGRDGLG